MFSFPDVPKSRQRERISGGFEYQTGTSTADSAFCNSEMSRDSTRKPLALTSEGFRLRKRRRGKSRYRPSPKTFECGSVGSTSNHSNPPMRRESNHARLASRVLRAVGDRRFQVQAPATGTAVQIVSVCAQNHRELADAFGVRPGGNANKCFFADSEDVATLQRAGQLDVPRVCEIFPTSQREGASLRRVSVPNGKITAISSTTIAGPPQTWNRPVPAPPEGQRRGRQVLQEVVRRRDAARELSRGPSGCGE